MSDRADRSFEKITHADLHRLSSLALADFEDFFQWSAYRERLMLICLCQGAARHYVTPFCGVATDREGGVNDFDVWGFFRHDPNDRPFPPRRHGLQDFGPSKFGRSVDDNPRFIGRRVDVWGRSIEKLPSENPIQAVQRYLRTHHSDSARLVAECPVVMLWPAERLGEIIWRG